ncbi:MAG: 1-acyl-sn-glycerol-3-phosphate acyltransferase [Arcicella sp.]|nr:1-acyl-sn-glycerol-3-phosphate acyltransferase [Arcicella sp.]
MLRYFFKFFFQIIGWKTVGSFPKNIKKTISIVAPHASWVDFPIGLGVRAKIELDHKITINFLGKAELFQGLFGWLFRGLGGIPVERFSKNDMVQSVVNLFNSYENLHIALAPEGTRKAVSKLRTGFYYMAKQANVPIVMIGFDFEKKQVIINQPFLPTDDMEEDLRTIAYFYTTIGGVKKEWIANYLRGEIMIEK